MIVGAWVLSVMVAALAGAWVGHDYAIRKANRELRRQERESLEWRRKMANGELWPPA